MAKAHFLSHLISVSIGIYTVSAFAQNSPQQTLSTLPTDLTQSAQKELKNLTNTVATAKLSKQIYQPDEKNATETLIYSKQCLPYKTIELRGITLIPTGNLLPEHNGCISEDMLNQLSKNITAAYLQAGYIYNPFQFQTDGTERLILQVIEGKVSKISGKDNIVNPALLFPNLIGQPLNIRDLDQGLDQTNRFSGSKVTLDVLPQENGDVEIALHNDYEKRMNTRLSIDNFGTKNTGEWVVRGFINIDSPLGLSDTFSLSASHSLRPHLYPYNRSAAFYYSIPYGYYTMSIFASLSQYRSDLNLPHKKLQQSGRTWQVGSRLERVVKRGSNAVSTAYIQLEHINAKNGLEDIVYMNQSPIISTANIGFNQLWLIENGLWLLYGNYEYGKLFKKNNSEGLYQNYHKFSTNIDFIAYHSWLSQTFRQQHRLTAQYSSTYLPTIKQQDILGRGSVRGFRFMSSTAEKALVLENNLFISKSWGDWLVEPYIGLDLGIQRNVAKEGQISFSSKALGGAVGVKTTLKQRYSFNLEWAKGKLFTPSENFSEQMLSFNASINF
ncbi:ShlB/FhaC/HecB family hemolysin secretion/activation protein [Rodentibacter sp. Ppn85]|uniref:ShlB/FhaC/HecB family hemolysin secretion/activation protein n=1 Tax=Rodentibacter sp. Ppn85 TaxID=1908525 RepID=UPI0009865322|nr:ShlB/FhaC/HecB family hemolysin secretion/activation protein [Rodentibacter sp. Ppn85]